jgi:hypothetical protein
MPPGAFHDGFGATEDNQILIFGILPAMVAVAAGLWMAFH